jgi:DNA-binding HxlR family transcriptional regulator
MAATHVRRSYEQFCPIARSLDLLGERWTLLIVRELLMGPQRYTDLRDRLPGMWSNLLAQRLRDLEAAGIVTRAELPRPAARTVYELTERGRALGPVLYEMARWGLPYLDQPSPEQSMPKHLLPEGIKAVVMLEALPARPIVVALRMDVGELTVRVAAPGGPLYDRLTVTPGVPDQFDVEVRGSVLEVLWVRRGEVELAGTNLAFTGSPAKIAMVKRMFGLTER